MFQLTDQPIDTAALRLKHHGNSYGALATFEGIVREDKYEHKTVISLMYIADHDACLQEGLTIINETLKQFPDSTVYVVQRIGQVNAGETAIWIGAWSPHRDQAFQACRYIIEESKKRLLIWKKEFFKDGSSQWVRGTQTPITL